MVVLVGLGIRLIGVDLHRQVLPRAHGDDLDDAVPLEVAHDLRPVLGKKGVQRRAVIRPALDVVHEPLVDRDVERLAVRDVAAYPPQTVDRVSGPNG